MYLCLPWLFAIEPALVDLFSSFLRRTTSFMATVFSEALESVVSDHFELRSRMEVLLYVPGFDFWCPVEVQIKLMSAFEPLHPLGQASSESAILNHIAPL